MRGTRRWAWLSTAVAAAGLVVGMAPAGADASYVAAKGDLVDLAPSTANATDGANADVWAVEEDGSTTFYVLFRDLDPDAEGTTFGAHIHVGPCVAGNGGAAGGHYNTGGTPSPTTEVWLDFTVLSGGVGYAITTVPFVIPSGAAHSMVVHVEATQADGATPGAAGSRQACLPIDF
jgi:Cu/Zn superoxide dismutase